MGMDNNKEHSRSSAQRELGLVTEVSQHAALVEGLARGGRRVWRRGVRRDQDDAGLR